MKKLKYKIRKIVNKFGIDVYPLDYRNSVQSYLQALIAQHNLTEIWDVGANSGQYAQMLRFLNYRGKIISFEALPNAYSVLETKSKTDPSWIVNGPFAIGTQTGRVIFYETVDSVSSSILRPKFSNIAQKIEVDVKPLSEFIPEPASAGQKLLKLDVQGAEVDVIKSCGNNINYFEFIQLEASIKPLYDDEINYIQIIELLDTIGFQPIFFFPGIGNEKNEVVQLEIIFTKHAK